MAVMALLAHASGLALTAPSLHAHTLDRLFGPEQLVAVPDFLEPALVGALAADAQSLRMRLPAVTASAVHGSVEWLVLRGASASDTPQPHASDDATGLRGRACLNLFVDDLRRHIEERAGVALDAHCELKYADYPCGGSYQKHVDGGLHTGSVARAYSFLLYLNEGWRASDGGFLRCFDLGGQTGTHRDIAPAAGTLVVFKSDVVPHEVRPTTKRRLAIVGWFHRHAEEAVPELEEEDLSPLARAILEHYREKGKAVRMR